MAYRHGDLTVLASVDALRDDCNADPDEQPWVLDSRHGTEEWRGGFPVVYLPHSCDRWTIGGPDQIRALIADLQAALEETP